MADQKANPNLPLMLRLKLTIDSFLFPLYMRSDGTVNRRLFNLLEAKTPAGTTVTIDNTAVTSSDISIDAARDLWLRLFVPKTTEKLPLIVYFHGGGFAFFSPKTKMFDDLCRTLAGKLPAVVASVNYRLAPEHKLPCQYDDAFDALRFIDAQNYAVLPANTDLKRCFLAGDSAGGNIAHHVAVRVLSHDAHQVFDEITLAGIVGLQPAFGGEERTESELRLSKAPVINAERVDKLWRMFLPAGHDRNHPAVNVFGVGDDQTAGWMKSVKFPRSLVIIGGYDPLQDWQKRHFYTRQDGTVNRRLFNLLDIKAPAPATKLIDATAISTSDIYIDPSRDLWFRLFVPDSNDHSDKPLPLIIYIHGGGFAIYGPDTKIFDSLCSHLAAKAQAVVASVNYRLTPEHKFPSQYDDVFDALTFIDAKNTAVFPANTDFSKCFVAGDSAGGNIAHHVTVRAVENAEQFYKIRIVGMVAVQPFFGGEERTASELRLENDPISGGLNRLDALWRHFLPEGADRNHPAAHVFGGGADSEAARQLKNLEFPTTLAIVGGHDPLQDWQRRYVEWLKNCGKEVEMIEFPNAFHGFYAFPELPESALFMDKVTNFVQKQANSK